MKDISFFSSNRYLFLPTKHNPKVALAVDNAKVAYCSFNIYNPFSFKAKFLKIVTKFYYVKLNPIFKYIQTTKKEKSPFLNFLEKELKETLTTSLYYATIKDKIVIQLQSSDAKIVGYIKYPLDSRGIKHIKNEIRALDILSKLNIVEGYILNKNYNGYPFVLLKELRGVIGTVEDKNLNSILKKFERSGSYLLAEHPRISNLKQALIESNMMPYVSKMETICNKTQKRYKLVYEHGDFVPWNIVKLNNTFMPFDFEYFMEDGLEYFDLIKYYYQTGKLLQNKSERELINYIAKKIDNSEILDLLRLFLIKEILVAKDENVSCCFEKNMFKIMETL